jgi:hypothetical protein
MIEEPMEINAEDIIVFSDKPNQIELDVSGGFEPYFMDLRTAKELLMKLASAIAEARKGR